MLVFLQMFEEGRVGQGNLGKGNQVVDKLVCRILTQQGEIRKCLSSTEKVDDRGRINTGRGQHDAEEKASWSKQNLSPSISLSLHPTPILFLLFVVCEHTYMRDCARPDPRAEVRRQFGSLVLSFSLVFQGFHSGHQPWQRPSPQLGCWLLSLF